MRIRGPVESVTDGGWITCRRLLDPDATLATERNSLVLPSPDPTDPQPDISHIFRPHAETDTEKRTAAVTREVLPQQGIG